MNFIKKNKDLLFKYLLILVSNIIINILCDFYLRNFVYKDIILLIIIVIVDLIIYYYKGIKKFVSYIDLIVNIIIGFILMLFIDNNIEYANKLFSVFLANNIIFERSRLSDKFFKKFVQYFMILIYTLIAMFINILTFILLIQM